MGWIMFAAGLISGVTGALLIGIARETTATLDAMASYRGQDPDYTLALVSDAINALQPRHDGKMTVFVADTGIWYADAAGQLPPAPEGLARSGERFGRLLKQVEAKIATADPCVAAIGNGLALARRQATIHADRTPTGVFVQFDVTDMVSRCQPTFHGNGFGISMGIDGYEVGITADGTNVQPHLRPIR